jgi:hypothetical protein
VTAKCIGELLIRRDELARFTLGKGDVQGVIERDA